MNATTKRMMVGLKSRQLDMMDNNTKEFSQTWDAIGDKVNLPQPGSAWSAGIEPGFRLNLNDVPEGFQFVQGINENGKPIRLIPKDAKEVKDPKTGRVIGYNGGHYDVTYYVPAGTKVGKKTMPRDTNITQDELEKAYEDSQSHGYTGSFNDFIKEQFNNKVLDFQLEGQNGKANRVSSWMSQMGLSNKMTKKGQMSPFAMDETDLITNEPEQPEEPEPTPASE
jgi:hypothetical protein